MRIKAVSLKFTGLRIFNDDFQFFQFFHGSRNMRRLHIKIIGDVLTTDSKVVIEVEMRKKKEHNAVLFTG